MTEESPNINKKNKTKKKIIIEENDLYELLGKYKKSEKKSFDYEEIIDQMESVNKTEIQKTMTEKLKTDDEIKEENV